MIAAKSDRPCHMSSSVRYRCSEGWVVCGGVGWDMAAAYTEPSPHLCAHVLAAVRLQRLFVQVPSISQLCVLKVPPALPRRGR